MAKVTMCLTGAVLLGGLALCVPPVLASAAEIGAAVAADAQALLRRGRMLLRLGQPDEAMEALSAAVRAAPDSARGRLWLGRALLAKGDAANAQRELEYAIRLAPDDPNAYVALAAAYRALGLMQAAEDTGRRLLARGHPRGHWIMGRALRAGGRHDEALAAFETYLAAAPEATPAERAAIERQRARVAAGPSAAERARDLLAWVDDPNLKTAHRMAYDAFATIAKVSESQLQGTWPYWRSHYDTLAGRYYPLIGEARRHLAAAAPRTALVRGFHDRYVAFLDGLDVAYRGFLHGILQQNPDMFLQARQAIPQLGAALEELVDDIDDESDDLAEAD
ncbi:MAG: tetratricopeptide repeat protein [Kiloniellales bacterium]